MTLSASKLECIRGTRKLFRQLSFTLEKGGALRIAGANGSGKSSLLRILCGLSMPHSGEVCWEGKSIRHLREQFYRRILFHGHAGAVKDDLLAWENLAFANVLNGRRISRQQACDALAAQGLAAVVNLPMQALSQGQRKRVALSRLALADSAQQPLWILDEAFTALDSAACTRLVATIDRHLSLGGSVIYTTHQAVSLAALHHDSIDLDQC